MFIVHKITYIHIAEATHFVIFLEPADRNKYLHDSTAHDFSRKNIIIELSVVQILLIALLESSTA